MAASLAWETVLHWAFQDGEDLEDALIRLYPGQAPLASTGRASSLQSAPDPAKSPAWPALVELLADRSSGQRPGTWRPR